jgi:hypothetical protein
VPMVNNFFKRLNWRNNNFKTMYILIIRNFAVELK